MRLSRNAASFRLLVSVVLVASCLPPAVAQMLGPEFRVNTYTTDSQMYADVAADDAGDFLVTWSSRPQDGSGWGIFAQRFNSAGVPAGAEFRVNTYTSAYQRHSKVAALGSGSFVVVWESQQQDGSGYGVFGRMSLPGGPAPGEFRVNSYTILDQKSAAVAATGPGTFVVVWKGEFQVNSYTTSQQDDPAVAAESSGDFVVVWTSWDQDGFDGGVFGQRLAALVFGDGFESGDACAFSPTIGGGC